MRCAQRCRDRISQQHYVQQQRPAKGRYGSTTRSLVLNKEAGWETPARLSARHPFMRAGADSDAPSGLTDHKTTETILMGGGSAQSARLLRP